MEERRLLMNLFSGFCGGGTHAKNGSIQLLEERQWEQNTAKQQMDSGGVSDHREAVAMYLKGKDSSLDSSSQFSWWLVKMWKHTISHHLDQESMFCQCHSCLSWQRERSSAIIADYPTRSQLSYTSAITCRKGGWNWMSVLGNVGEICDLTYEFQMLYAVSWAACKSCCNCSNSCSLYSVKGDRACNNKETYSLSFFTLLLSSM